MLHRMIMGLELENYKKVIVDHILHTDDGKNSFTNNRKSNLRITTQDKNVLNRGVLKSNTSGITGVSWNKNDNVWCAYITYNKKKDAPRKI